MESSDSGVSFFRSAFIFSSPGVYTLKRYKQREGMMEPQQTRTNGPFERKKLLAVALVSLFIILMAGGFIVLGAIMGTKTTSPGNNDAAKDTASSEVAGLFYDALGNAAKQQQLRVAMHRATYANKADADSASNTGTESSSVAELDTTIGKMRSVYVTNVSDSTTFNVGRCMDGTTYMQFDARNKPKTIKAAIDAVTANQGINRVTEALTFIPCPGLGLMPGDSTLASFRFSDGVFPVTLSDAQATNWKNKVKEANLFTFKDEGMVERDGKNLKKIGFTSKDDTTNATLFSLFTDAAQVAKTKAENPKAQIDYAFISIGPRNTGAVGGFYLIDEKTKLPVYSELYSTNADKALSDGESARYNIARTKQAYRFGQPLSMTLESPLEITR